jgi:2-hydroxychromene-2-carboxylate isomerase
MKPDQYLRSLAMRHWANRVAVESQKKRFHIARKLTGKRHRVYYFHQVDDPYSQLAAQCISRLRRRYDADIEFLLVPPPEDVDVPERQRLAAYADQDCAQIAPHFGLGYTRRKRDAAEDVLALAQLILITIQGSCGRTDKFDKFDDPL